MSKDPCALLLSDRPLNKLKGSGLTKNVARDIVTACSKKEFKVRRVLRGCVFGYEFHMKFNGCGLVQRS